MSKLTMWISALRPRTIFLAMAGALMGNTLAYSVAPISISILVLTLLTAVSLQLLSNLANDLGDYQHGTDVTGERKGPQRAVQSGIISPKEMKYGILVVALITACSGCFLLYKAIGYLSVHQLIFFLILGILALIAAITYTLGKHPYGYVALGDFFSFLFFGPVAVIGTFFLQTHFFSFYPVLPSVCIGLLTASVLNLNNMRDIENDKRSGKKTVVVILGLRNAKIYHAALTGGAFLMMLLFSIFYASFNWVKFSYLVVFVVFFFILIKIIKTQKYTNLDSYLGKTALTTFLLVICFSFCLNA